MPTPRLARVLHCDPCDPLSGLWLPIWKVGSLIDPSAIPPHAERRWGLVWEAVPDDRAPGYDANGAPVE